MEQFTTPINRSLTLIQHKEMLTFGTDAYLLYAYLKKKAKGRAVELGAGSGVISLLTASAGKFEQITAVEVQPEQAKLCADNAAANGLSNQVTTLCANVKDLTSALIGGEVDAVFANPPYMTVGSGKANVSDAKYIARHEVLGTIADFAFSAARVLKFGGSFYAVWRPDRLPALFGALAQANLAPKRMTAVCADAVTAPSLVLVEARKGGAPDGFFLTRPLLLHENAKTSPLMDTPDCKFIYENGEFPDEYVRP
ncbi:MAG: methyltransferase [Clostridia bacterium]|nr:methyltransferase [Clostridia bacterium]